MGNDQPLTPAEQKLINCAAKGDVAEYKIGDKLSDDPAQGEAWGAERTIRANVIYDLATESHSDWPVHAMGIQINGARIIGFLDLKNAEITRPFKLYECVIDGIGLQFARSRTISLAGSYVRSGIGAAHVKVFGSLILTKTMVKGGMALAGASVYGNLKCSGGGFWSPNGYAIMADGLYVSGAVFLNEGFNAEGRVTLKGVEIGAQLVCSGGHFWNLGGEALNVDGIRTKGSVFLHDKFTAEGEVRLIGAKIGGQLACSGGHFRNPGNDALNADGVRVDGDVFLRDGFMAEGRVRLIGASIGGDFVCLDGRFQNQSGDALNLKRAKIMGALIFEALPHQPEGTINFTSVQVGQFEDDQSGWPNNGHLEINGFEYNILTNTPSKIHIKKRLEWLRLQPAFLPQPYEQLIHVLRRMGYEREARLTAVAKQEALRTHLTPTGRIASWLLWATTGYGYKPWLAFFWMVGLVALGTLFFTQAHSDGMLVPTDIKVYATHHSSYMARLPGGYPAFQPILYSLDVAVPFVDLGQKSHWQLQEQRTEHWLYWLFEFWFVVQELTGWVLLLVAATAPTRLVRKD